MDSAAAYPLPRAAKRDGRMAEPWLDPATPAAEAKALLGRNLGRELQFVRVGREVNQAKFKGEECIRPVNPL
ncbi:hypothetical protein ACG873_01430 (plasmid) [Mesorhizobium sp. AaZ16]|uniref:hypothetical protein n=1 Tax=Mesorhizobium sp. AaZ16 TaxID=3402289 RepID=UPI00374EAC88